MENKSIESREAWNSLPDDLNKYAEKKGMSMEEAKAEIKRICDNTPSEETPLIIR